MKETVRPNYRQERNEFENYKNSNQKLGLFFPFRIAFEIMKRKHELN